MQKKTFFTQCSDEAKNVFDILRSECESSDADAAFGTITHYFACEDFEFISVDQIVSVNALDMTVLKEEKDVTIFTLFCLITTDGREHFGITTEGVYKMLCCYDSYEEFPNKEGEDD